MNDSGMRVLKNGITVTWQYSKNPNKYTPLCNSYNFTKRMVVDKEVLCTFEFKLQFGESSGTEIESFDLSEFLDKMEQQDNTMLVVGWVHDNLPNQRRNWFLRSDSF